jgi:hypothetical protein
LLVSAGCARVPVESVELSDMVGKDLAVLHAAHVNLARQYFSTMRDNINGFVDEKYRPFVIDHAIRELGLVDELRNAIENPGELTANDILEVFTEEAMLQIESFRREMLAPIDAQEKQLLADLDQTYMVVGNANATITAHLRSVVAVQEAQAEVLGDVGLPPDLAERISGSVATLSDEVARILAEGRKADAVLEDLPNRIKSLTDGL